MSQDDPKQALSPTRFARSSKDDPFTWHWDLSDKSLTDGVAIKLPPSYVVPIVFVPGIMGSNLMVTKNVGGLKAGAPSWLVNGDIGVLSKWIWRRAETRQLRLNPDTTDVYPDGDVPGYVESIGDAKVIRTKRYWGEVIAGYGGFLRWLEEALNVQSAKNTKQCVETWSVLNDQVFSSQWGALNPFIKQTSAQVDHCARIRFPVYACGYNWLQDNLQSAERLKKRIEEVIEANNFGPSICQQVILVTHSMGGLVARACSELKKMSPNIAGIVHGVMPALGSATAYKRVRAGTEGGAGLAIGPDAETVGAVFANAPGALQLLPSHLYPARWLKVGRLDKRAFNQTKNYTQDFFELESLPKTDPYTEIYGLPDAAGNSVRGAWWSLMPEELINPARTRNSGWNKYLINLEFSKDFHTQLGARYHRSSYAFYGSDGGSDGLTWGTIRWECQGTLTDVRRNTINSIPSDVAGASMMNMTKTVDDGEGMCHIASKNAVYKMTIGKADSSGDGTVPKVSGSGPQQAKEKFGASVRQTYEMKGFGHQYAYDNSQVRLAALHSILQIASEVQLGKVVKA